MSVPHAAAHYKPRDPSFYGINRNPHYLGNTINEATGRPRSMPPAHHTHPRIKTGTTVTFDNPEAPGTLQSARVKYYDPYKERYCVQAGGAVVSGLRATQLRVDRPHCDGSDHMELMDPKPPLRAAMAMREFCQWRDEFSVGRKGAHRWHKPSHTGGSSRSLSYNSTWPVRPGP
mmetsp:Transcript_7262/g.13432  ORF Transcript_7262/g.13432 Transcript_7262/m.13432 type:complete len:174 (-) Transcript_7262:157-678(-)